jgi:hypothetical protein
MSWRYDHVMLSKSEEELDKYLQNHQRYVAGAIDAAVVELQSRGRSFSYEELQKIDRIIFEKYAVERVQLELEEAKIANNKFRNFFIRFFSSSAVEKENVEGKVDNARLRYRLEIWNSHQSEANFYEVIEELRSGNSFLMLPVVDVSENKHNVTAQAGSGEIKFTSIFDSDGLKVIFVFTSEKWLFNWTEQSIPYLSVPADKVLDFCAGNHIDRIVINNNSPEVFVLDSLFGRIGELGENNFGKACKPPIRFFSRRLVHRLNKKFNELRVISEVYLFAIERSGEIIQILGLNLSVISPDSRLAVHNLLYRAFAGERFRLPLEIMILTKDDSQKVKESGGMLFYKSPNLATSTSSGTG